MSKLRWFIGCIAVVLLFSACAPKEVPVESVPTPSITAVSTEKSEERKDPMEIRTDTTNEKIVKITDTSSNIWLEVPNGWDDAEWTSDNHQVVAVDVDGKLTPINNGASIVSLTKRNSLESVRYIVFVDVPNVASAQHNPYIAYTNPYDIDAILSDLYAYANYIGVEMNDGLEKDSARCFSLSTNVYGMNDAPLLKDALLQNIEHAKELDVNFMDIEYEEDNGEYTFYWLLG